MICYNSTNESFKMPFGAVPCGTTVQFRILAENCESAYLITDTLGEFEMCPDKEASYFTVSITPVEAGLLFYHFRVHDNFGNTIYCGKGAGNDSYCTRDSSPDCFRLTVYEQTPSLPDWYKKGIVYQIFPDRFAVGKSGVIKAKENAHYRTWDESPSYIKDENGDITTWDFYGGNLEGIIQKLPYLKELGVTAIYLNPIFQSASNHRYSTADFRRIDNVLGDINTFKRLISEAKACNIHIILDGVFNHVGADSMYFNKYKTYGTDGAYQNFNSKYTPWFRFKEYPNEYDCWWGVKDLPDLNTYDDSLRRYLLTDTNSIIKYWTRLGIGGWRLDVADELPDDFLALLYKTVKAHNSESVVMGEVWEDASFKIAYNTRKKYFTNRELDCVMNYPFRDSLLSFFSGETSAQALADGFTSQMENYPPEAFGGNLNLLGSHDVERIYTKATDICPQQPLSLLEQLVALQFVFPGVPSIYYGDEVGLTGGKDPDNRKPFPWGNADKSVFSIYKKYTALRTELSVLQNGDTLFFAEGEHVFGVTRHLGNTAYTLKVNRANEVQYKIAPHGIWEEYKE